MLKKRLIPCLFLKNGFLVRSERFETHQLLGNAIHQVERFNEWEVDELIYIDITRDEDYNIGRQDLKVKGDDDILAILEKVSRTCFMPLTFGGKIRSLNDIQARISRGADKVTLNTIAIEQPDFISQSAQFYGSQAIIVSMDVKELSQGEYGVFYHHGLKTANRNPVEWAREVEKLGAGEIFLNSIDRDGMACGYDLKLLEQVSSAVKIPVIACGGVGQFKHLAEGIKFGGVDAVAAGNIFHFTELSAKQARKALIKMQVDVRN